jgi:mono/diheme cytochrome c family protein
VSRSSGFALFVCLSVAARAQTPPTTRFAAAGENAKPARFDKAEASAGRSIYVRYCAGCHGPTLKGDGPVAPGLVKKPGDLTTIAVRNGFAFPFDKVAAIIDGRKSKDTHEAKDMPVWGEVFAVTALDDTPTAERAVSRLTHYVWSKQAKAAEPGKP